MAPKNAICIWYDRAALEAATFYARTFADGAVKAVHRTAAKRAFAAMMGMTKIDIAAIEKARRG